MDAHEAGKGYEKIAKPFQVAVSLVCHVIKKCQLMGMVEVKLRSGREYFQRELLIGLLERLIKTPV